MDSISDKTGKKSLPEFLSKGGIITDEENILYSIGWFETEVSEGGLEQYFLNGNAVEFEYLIKALTLVGAMQTVKIFQERTKPNADFELLGIEMKNEDYISKAIGYLRKIYM